MLADLFSDPDTFPRQLSKCQAQQRILGIRVILQIFLS